MVLAPLKACPKCNHLGGLAYCPVCHDETNDPLGKLFNKYSSEGNSIKSLYPIKRIFTDDSTNE